MIIMAIIAFIITSLIMITSNIHGVITAGTIRIIIINLISIINIINIIIKCISVGNIMIVFTRMHRIYVTINIINVTCVYPCPKRFPPC